MPPGSISVLSAPNSSMLIPARYKLLICSAGFQTGRSAHICYSLYFVYLTIFPNKASRKKPAILSKFGHDIHVYLTRCHKILLSIRNSPSSSITLCFISLMAVAFPSKKYETAYVQAQRTSIFFSACLVANLKSTHEDEPYDLLSHHRLTKFCHGT